MRIILYLVVLFVFAAKSKIKGGSQIIWLPVDVERTLGEYLLAGRLGVACDFL